MGDEGNMLEGEVKGGRGGKKSRLEIVRSEYHRGPSGGRECRIYE